eukprot:TRINITY_DN15458_c0_g1_i1.p1 TRINITY_DN15458_c0_g1~~TRINITY_DN15458_c0_g1_i1.p1  ORF type:complete len:434 (-),score=112.23 TRINITY_DN15458_c0_g1_i1:269-1570(-)
MEVQVEALPSWNVPKGSYVSVRLGDSLKQLRFDEGSRNFNFAASFEGKKKAKIDLYQLVGTCSVPIDPVLGTSDEVTVNCCDPDKVAADPSCQPKIRVSCHAKDNQPKDDSKRREAYEKDSKDSAVGYLASHGVEQRLSEAIRLLLRLRPDDPIDFICKQLRNGGPSCAPNTDAKKAVPPPAKTPAPEPAVQLSNWRDYYSRAILPTPPQEALTKIYDKFPGYKAATSMAKPAVSSSAAPVHLSNWRDYYSRAILPTPPQEAFNSLYEKFPGYKAATSMAKPAVSSSAVPSSSSSADFNLQGLNAPSAMSVDERCEAERALTRALFELNGELAGEYLPLPSSLSCPWRPDGPSAEDKQKLQSNGWLVNADDPTGRGVFMTGNEEMAVLVNPGTHVVQIKVKSGFSPDEVSYKVAAMKSALSGTLQQDGYAFVG